MQLRILQFMTILAIVTVSLFSCQEDPGGPLEDPESLTMADRRALGDLIVEAIKDPNSGFNIYSPEEFPDLNAHFQELYNQAYFVKADIADWDVSDPLSVIILKNEEQIATVLPGGHFVISKGFAKLFTKEYELFYVMAFEFELMNENHLLESMAQFVENISDLRELAENGDVQRALEIGTEIFNGISYDSQIVTQMDELAIKNICENSSFKSDGLRAFWSQLNPDDQWLSTRVSPINRNDLVKDLMLNQVPDCTVGKVKATSKGEDYYVNRILRFLGE